MNDNELIAWGRERVTELFGKADDDSTCERVYLMGALSALKRVPAGSRAHDSALWRLWRVHEGRFTYWRNNPTARAAALRLGSR